MVGSNRELVGRLLLMSSATMTLLAVCAWIGILPVPSDSQYVLAMVLGAVAALEAAIALVLLVRS